MLDHLRNISKLSFIPVLFGIILLGIKYLENNLSNEIIVFYRNLFTLIFFIPFLLKKRKAKEPLPMLIEILISLSMLGNIYILYSLIGYISFFNTLIFYIATPICIPIVLRIWIGKKISQNELLAICIGLLGLVLSVFFISKDFYLLSLMGITLPFLNAFCWLGFKRMHQSNSPIRLLIVFFILPTLVASAPLAYSFTIPSFFQIIVLLTISLLSLPLIFFANKKNFIKLTPFTFFLFLVFATLLDFIFWKRTPPFLSLFPNLLVLLGSFLIIKKQKNFLDSLINPIFYFSRK